MHAGIGQRRDERGLDRGERRFSGTVFRQRWPAWGVLAAFC